MLPLILDRLRQRGLAREVDALVTELGIPPPSTHPALAIAVPLDVHRTACERAAELLGDPCLGLHAAIEGPRGSYGLFEFTVRSSATLADVAAQVRKFLPLLTDLIQLTLRVEGNTLLVIHQVDDRPNAGGRHTNEYGLGVSLRFIREMSAVRIVPREVRFSHPRPGDVSEVVRWFGTTALTFDCADNRLVLDAGILSLPVKSADPELFQVLERQAELAMPPTRPKEPVPGLRTRIRNALEAAGSSTLPSAARELHVSARTLQRRLAEAGSTFQRELDIVREELAVKLLSDSSRSIYEVAMALGYADQAAFERAFRRWRGRTPRQFRSKASGGP